LLFLVFSVLFILVLFILVLFIAILPIRHIFTQCLESFL